MDDNGGKGLEIMGIGKFLRNESGDLIRKMCFL